MKLNIPIVGRVKTGKDAQEQEPQIRTVEVPAKEKGVFLGTFVDLFKKNLSDETSVSNRLIQAYTEWVFANVSVLGEEVSKLTPKLYRHRLVKGQIELVEIDEHPVLDLLDRFNDSTTSSDGFYVTEAHLDLAGDSFWYLDGKEPKNIFILQPDKMELELGDYNDASARLVKSYKYKVKTGGEYREVIYDPDEIIHFKVPNPQNPYRGKSTVEATAQSIDTDLLSNEALRNFFDNGMIANFALSTESNLNPDQIKNLQAQLRSTRTGAKNAFKVPIFTKGLKAEQLQMNNKEVQLLEIEEWLRDKIMVMFKNTKASLGIVEDVNRANAEATLGEWRRSVVKPKMQRIIDALNEFLLPRYGNDLILGFDDPVPEDRLAKIEEVGALYAKQGVSKVISLNEARDMLGMDAVKEEGADDVTQPLPPQLEQPMESPKDEKHLPAPLKNVSWVKHFRRNGWYEDYHRHKQIYDASREAAKVLIKNKVKKPPQRRVVNFWRRVSDIIDEYEAQFNSKLEQFITSVVEEASSQIDNEEARNSGDLFDRERRLIEAQAIFAPILLQAVSLAGQEANRLLGIKEPYIPKKVKQVSVEDTVREQIDMFATSMLDTDKDVLAKILAQGLQDGDGIPVIRAKIQEKFGDFTKSQAERITRTEVAWAANRGIVDSYKQSGVVAGKQWLTAPGACDYCEPLNGTIVELEESYFDQGDEHLGNAKTPLKLDYRSVEEPPLHPNCRCTTISVIEGLEPLIEAKTSEQMKQLGRHIKLLTKITELESKIDKRTKAYRELKQAKLADEEKIKELEKLATS